jgi:hypothetical protein
VRDLAQYLKSLQGRVGAKNAYMPGGRGIE